VGSICLAPHSADLLNNEIDYRKEKVRPVLLKTSSAKKSLHSPLKSSSDCSKNIQVFDDKTQICSGYSSFAVPGYCQSVAGASWISIKHHYHLNDVSDILQLQGVQSFGADCGFGRPAVATEVTSFLPWIESVVFPHQNGEINLSTSTKFKG
jgi:Trypsin